MSPLITYSRGFKDSCYLEGLTARLNTMKIRQEEIQEAGNVLKKKNIYINKIKQYIGTLQNR